MSRNAKSQSTTSHISLLMHVFSKLSPNFTKHMNNASIAFTVMFHQYTTSDIKVILRTNVDITGDYCKWLIVFTASSAWLIELSGSN